MKEKSLIRQLMSRFAVFMVAILIVSTPVFYLIVTNFYAEDLMEAAQLAGIPADDLDIKEDTIIGLVFQIVAIVAIIGFSIFLIMRLVPAKLWQPFYETMRRLSLFHVEDGTVPQFEPTSTKEFAELNATLTRILSQSVKSYQVQKLFTENASHELQTPLAIIQGKLDLLLQDPDLTDSQALLMQDIYHEVNHISQLNRSLLLLARIENAQYQRADHVVLSEKLSHLLPSLQILAGDLTIHTNIKAQEEMTCNEVLLESMLRNLVANAVRHNRKDGEITISLEKDRLTIANTSDEPALDTSHIFERFHQSGSANKGNGLGLAIVKSICDYHGWAVAYSFESDCHQFSVVFA